MKQDFSEKRKLVNILFLNSSYDGVTLEYTLRSPFDIVVESKKVANWGRLIDNLVTLAPIIDYNNRIADLLQTG